MDNNEEFIISDELDGGDDNVASSSSEETDSQPATDPNQMSLEELNSFLGKSFKSKETALKSIKDTFSYVGRKKEDVAKEITPDKFITKEQYEQDMFYAQNKEYNSPEIREVIDAMSKAKGVSVRDVVESDSFKSIFQSVVGFKENQNLKSVFETNPRITATKSAFTEAQKAMNSGNKEAAEDIIVKAVMDNHGM